MSRQEPLVLLLPRFFSLTTLVVRDASSSPPTGDEFYFLKSGEMHAHGVPVAPEWLETDRSHASRGALPDTEPPPWEEPRRSRFL
ncbi:unnamed protein product [Rangifer tarandus platyrhynchus]|uniref:Uncharacterized protein n=1 Tax=Rangifer tarandus platyrhynchus TaxID=3082113 RepID=A0AC59Y4B4_RANTA